MKDFKGKTAVVTGAADGIGRAIAMKCISEGMRVALVDINYESANLLAASMNEAGGHAIAYQADVSKKDEVEEIASRVFKELGDVHLLCNNAGVLKVASILDHTESDWNWVLGVNLVGVVNCVRAFTPSMLMLDSESHIVNTASLAAFTTGPGLCSYKVSKHALLAFSEVLHHELHDSLVKVSILCPGWVKTKIMDSDHNQVRLQISDSAKETELSKSHRDRGRVSAYNGKDPAEIAEQMFDGIVDNRLYIITEDTFLKNFLGRVKKIVGSINRETEEAL
jgi:NAD(P)-dependent dehydrogenase (short-subunit alcohol dehydrogenase family)